MASLDFMTERSFPCKDCKLIFYREKNLKKHMRSHGSPCNYCGKVIKRAQNMTFHQGTCEKNPYRYVASGSGTAATATTAVTIINDRNFELLQSAFNNTMVVYRKKLIQQDTIDDLKYVFDKELHQLLRREACKRLHFKWYVALKVVFRKTSDSRVITDPPVCFRTDPRVGLISTDYQINLLHAYNDVIEQIDTYERNGSGWVLDHLVELDINICTINNPIGGNDNK